MYIWSVIFVDGFVFFFFRILQEKERSTVSPKNNDDLIPLKQQINKLYEDFVTDSSSQTDVDKVDEPSREDSPKTQHERTNEINQLLQKLSRVEKAYTAIKRQNEPSEM